jgi:hypothetical protein
MSRRVKLVLLGLVVFIAIVLLFSSCSPSYSTAYAPQYAPPVVAQAPVIQPAPVVQAAPVIVQQSHNDGFINGLLLGHMMSGGSNHTVVHHYDAPRPAYVAPRTTVVNNTTVINRPAAPAYVPPRPAYVAPKPAYVAPRATSYAGSYSSRSTYSSVTVRSVSRR